VDTSWVLEGGEKKTDDTDNGVSVWIVNLYREDASCIQYRQTANSCALGEVDY
jgi:hypothetical protein